MAAGAYEVWMIFFMLKQFYFENKVHSPTAKKPKPPMSFKVFSLIKLEITPPNKTVIALVQIKARAEPINTIHLL